MNPEQAHAILYQVALKEHSQRYPMQPAQFPKIYCSQCGEGFGTGKEGFSDCEQHEGLEQTT